METMNPLTVSGQQERSRLVTEEGKVSGLLNMTMSTLVNEKKMEFKNKRQIYRYF